MSSGSNFQETRWTQVECAQGKGEAAALALSDLCAAYHRPVQTFVRHWCRDEELAKDLTQDFFMRMLTQPALAAERGRGRFRAYLLGMVKHFLLEKQRAACTLKRGGEEGLTRLDDHDCADSSQLPPDQFFDQQWACSVLDRALDDLEAEMTGQGKVAQFQTLRPWLVESPSHGDQQTLAQKLGISETAIRVQVHRLRKRYREWIEAEVSQTLNGSACLQDEMQHLLAALARR